MKVGIVTLYHQNYNYGGQLQAYALVKVINQTGHVAEQIRLINLPKILAQHKDKNISIDDLMYKLEKKVISKLFLKSKFELRKCALDVFSDEVPHSEKIYTSENVGETNDLYDAFVAGSDQIWNPVFTEKRRLRNNLLDFVGRDKIRISYAASIGGFTISEEDEPDFKELLSMFDGISVREKTAKDCLSKTVQGKEIMVCVDPVLLLTVEDWTQISVKPEVDGKYIFCYFLSDNQAMRDRAREIAKKNNMKIVTLPHMMTNYKRSDRNFGNIQRYKVNPKEFVGLIANASYVVTDSFHATVFSSIFKRNFIVFKRGFDENGTSMDSRLQDFTRRYGLDSRLIEPESSKIDKILLEEINYDPFEKISSYDRASGVDYLREKLRICL